jgi:hypothetical protein
MKAYVVTTGILFGLLCIVHLLRIVTESRALARDPFYLAITALAAALALWAAWVLRQGSARAHAGAAS